MTENKAPERSSKKKVSTGDILNHLAKKDQSPSRYFTVDKETKISKDLIEKAVDWVELSKDRLALNSRYYDGQHDILKRKKPDSKKNNRVVVNYAEYIVDMFVGYLHGQPVEYSIDAEEGETEESLRGKYKKYLDPIIRRYRELDMHDMDNEIARKGGIYGRIYELEYANEMGEMKTTYVDPEKAVIVYDNSVDQNPMYAITYSSREVSEADSDKYIYKDLVVSDSERIYEYSENLLNVKEEREHFCGELPMGELVNAEDLRGDFEKVLTLIDALNVLQSDRINDKEQLVDAIIVMYGFSLEEEDAENIKDNRMVFAPAKSEGADVGYVTRELNEADVEILKKSIVTDIHKIAKVPDVSDEQFAGDPSGVAIRYKLLPFEWKANTKETKFTKLLKRRFRIYSHYMSIVQSDFVPMEESALSITFKRNLPQNDTETSNMINNLSGIISQETLAGQVSFVEDARAEIEKQRVEAQQRADELAEKFGSIQPNGEDDDGEDQDE